MATIDMQTMRYINLLDRTSRVKTTKCFLYNNTIIFAVPNFMLARAIGKNSENIRDIQAQIGKKIKIVTEPSGKEDAQKFIESIVSPVNFKSLEIKDGVMTINAGSQSKAALIGRNKRRYEELARIVKDTYSLDLRIA